MIRKTLVRFICAVVIAAPGASIYAQEPLPPVDQQQSPPAQLLPPQELDTLVAPIALYPDSLLSQLLVASTYPLELVEANQWLGQNGGLQGQALVDAAKQQNWDPSVQALVVFPDVVRRLTQDIRWTTSLGNAFLAQQPDVMSAVQRMRAEAQRAGKLQSTPQQNVITQTQGGQPVIEIEPANPQIIYVPTYNPAYIWGPPAFGYYPPLYYPGVGVGFSFGYGISIGAFFGGGWGGGWGGWGWHPDWGGRTIIVNNNFFHRYGYNDFHGGRDFGRGSAVWAHDPGHREGVPYPNRDLSSRYRGSEGGNFGRAPERSANPQQNLGRENLGRENFGRAPERAVTPQQNLGRAPGQAASPQQNFGRNNVQPQAPRNFNSAPQVREAPRTEAPAQRFGGQQFEQRNNGGSSSAFGRVQDGGRTRMESDHGFSSMHSAPAPRASAPAQRGGGGGGGERGGGGHRR